MASESAPHLSEASKRFLRNHTKVETLYEDADDCSICHEEYRETSEQRVRVVGIPACRHAYGHRCLEQWLATDPYTAKYCPMCRTEWVPAPAIPPQQWWTQDENYLADEYDTEDTEHDDSSEESRLWQDILRLRNRINMETRAPDFPVHQRVRALGLLDLPSPTGRRERRERRSTVQDAGELRTRAEERRPRTRVGNILGAVLGHIRGRLSPTRRRSSFSSEYNEVPSWALQEPRIPRDPLGHLFEVPHEPRTRPTMDSLQVLHAVNALRVTAYSNQRSATSPTHPGFGLVASAHPFFPDRLSNTPLFSGIQDNAWSAHVMQLRAMQTQSTTDTSQILTQTHDRATVTPEAIAGPQADFVYPPEFTFEGLSPQLNYFSLDTPLPPLYTEDTTALTDWDTASDTTSEGELTDLCDQNGSLFAF